MEGRWILRFIPACMPFAEAQTRKLASESESDLNDCCPTNPIQVPRCPTVHTPGDVTTAVLTWYYRKTGRGRGRFEGQLFGYVMLNCSLALYPAMPDYLGQSSTLLQEGQCNYHVVIPQQTHPCTHIFRMSSDTAVNNCKARV